MLRGLHVLVPAIAAAAVAAVGCTGELGDDSRGTSSHTPDGMGGGGTSGDGGAGGGGDTPIDYEKDPLAGLPTGQTQWALLCARGYDDDVARAFCNGAVPPSIGSFRDVRQLLGLDLTDLSNLGANSHVRITATGHSTAVGGRSVTPVNPRVFYMTPPNGSGGAPNPRYTVIAFARGEFFVELASKDPSNNGEVRFFLLRFHPACESSADGCDNYDKFSPEVESGWEDWSLYADDDIGNTTLDCNQCHQPNGPGTKKILRMQERKNPWLHWFYIEHADNAATMDDFHTAHDPEGAYGGIPTALIDPSRPVNLQRLVENNGFAPQPNEFDSLVIDGEMQNGQSPTWNALYAQSKAGAEIPVPYHSVPQTDAALTQAAIQDYLAVMNGTLSRDHMPDMGALVAPSALSELSYAPAPGLDARGIMRMMCQHCHNSRLDQTISRSNFDVEDFDNLSAEVKAEAIYRLTLPMDAAQKMPPPRFHQLSQAEIDLLIDALSQ